ncbi:MAG TPA: F0F1 ATP synthase subunit delta [Rhizomicrobium sp.]|nr:F0F1 ATP synthase subunit delta [Rhizomicrobium sp.]
MADQGHNSTIAGRYATAIFDLAMETNSLDTVAADLAQLKAAMKASPDLTRLVKAPVFSRDDQKKGMGAVLTQMGASRLTIQFINLLAAKRRLFGLADIVAAFDAKLARHKGITKAEVTSARALNDGELAQIKAVLKAKLDREPELETHVDPQLLGGLIVKIGSRMIDSSLRSKLNGMRSAMRGR